MVTAKLTWSTLVYWPLIGQDSMRQFFAIGIFGLLLLVLPPFVEAADLTLQSDFKTSRVGDDVLVNVVLDTEGQTINTIGLTLTYPTEFLEFEDFDDGESVVSLWVERPKHADGKIMLSGITPGGFSGEAVPIISLYFKAKALGQGKIDITDKEILLHDGAGTQAETQIENLHLAVVAGPSVVSVQLVDDELPEAFTPEIVRDPDLFGGAPSLIFATEDKGSGLDYMAVKEGWFGSYIQTESPYQLQYQNLDKKIYVKAVDKNGNTRVAILYPQNGVGQYEQSLRIVGILVLCLLALYFIRSYFRTCFG